MADIFVSYASEDRERAKAIAQALEQQGWSVWWDRVIPPGKQWADVIESEINAARCVVVLWSKVSVRGDWVKKEARAGLRRRILVPALIESADPPFEFEDIQAADLTGWTGDAAHPELTKLCAAIAEHAGSPPAAIRATEEAEARARTEAEAQVRRERETKARERQAQEAARQEAEARKQAERRARAEAEEQSRIRAEAERRAQVDARLIVGKVVETPGESEKPRQEKPRAFSAGKWLLGGVAAVILLGVFSYWDAEQERRRTEQTEAEQRARTEIEARARRAEEEAWALAERIRTPEAFRDYLAKVERREIPGVHEGDAQKRLQELQRAEEEKKAAADARAQAERESRLKAEREAKAREADEAAWAAARRAGTEAALVEYLGRAERREIPGTYVDDARRRLGEMRRLAQEEKKAAEAKALAEQEARAKAEAFAPGTIFRDCPDCPEMVVIPAGSFVMGSPEREAGRGDDEGPQHKVTIARPLAVGMFEVTFDEWDACVAAKGCKQRPDDRGWGRGRRPVMDVNWDDARQYVAWLSRKAGKTYRLLSEAEWEYAARAGVIMVFPWGNDPGRNRANFKESGSQWSGRQTAPVGSFKPNAFGLYDMIGNVSEWVQDCWNDNYGRAPRDGAPMEMGDCSKRLLRGGSWNFNPLSARVANRNWYQPNLRFDYVGFRVARTL